MRIVDDYRKWLLAIYPLKTSWHSRQRGDPFCDGVGRTPAAVRRSCSSEDVVHVNSADKRRKNGHYFFWHNQVEARAVWRNVDFVGVQFSTPQSVGHYFGTTLPADPCQLLTVLVFSVENGDARRIGPAALEQHLLGCEILFHRVMIVEVVASEIGEHGYIEWNAEDSL